MLITSKPEDEMWALRESDKPDYGKDALTFAVGALGGLAVGVALSRMGAPQRVERLGSGLRERANDLRERTRGVAQRFRPARLRREPPEQLDLTRLEDTVLDAFLADEVLSGRGIDVGAISKGIIELSGSVWSAEEADRAVRLANTLPGVETVVNRMEIESEAGHLERTRRRLEAEGGNVTSLQHGTARVGGMGTRRQGRETDPDRPDESQHREQRALAEADRQEWMYEGYAAASPQLSEAAEVQDAQRTHFREDQLDNQDPHGKHASRTLDEQPQRLNTASRVTQDSQGVKPGIELRLEDADVPVKPHSDGWAPQEDRRGDGYDI